MKVFISYGGTADQITALRLQALAVAHGLTVYVPPAYTRKEIPDFLDPQSAQKLSEAEIILGLVGTGLAKACQQEPHRDRPSQEHDRHVRPGIRTRTSATL